MDEIFKNENFLGCISIVVKPEGRNYGSLAKTHEFALVYSNGDSELYELEIQDKNFTYKDKDGGFNLKDLKNGNTYFNIKNRPNLYFPIYVDIKSKDKNDLYQVSLHKKKGFIEVYPKKSKGVQCVWRWGREKVEKENNNLLAKKLRDGTFSINQVTRRSTTRPKTFWNEKEFYTLKGNQHLEKLFGKKVFTNPKPEHLIKRILEISSIKGDLVLDFHMGSGTTCSVAHKMGLQYIGIEQMGYIENVAVERLKKVIGKANSKGKLKETIEKYDDGGISKAVNWKGGGDFVYCELKELNEEAVDKIESVKTIDNLLKIWKEMVEHYFLSYDVDIKRFNDNQEEFKKLPIEKQKKLLVEMLNKNQLYVNLSEIDDAQFKVSKEDKELNKKFYK